MGAFGEVFGQNMSNSGDSLMSIVRIINTLTESTMSNTKRLVCDGNSLTLGTGAPGYSYPSQLNLPDYSIVNLGIGSQRTVTMTANGVANVDTPYWRAGNNRNIVVAWEIINDLTVVTKEQAYLNYVAYCEARKAAGWQVIAVTCIANQTNPLASLTYVNEQIRANWQNYADVLCDLAADSRFQNYNNTTYYTGDRVHLNATGYALVAQFIRASVLSLPYAGYKSALRQLCTNNGAAGTGSILNMLNQLSGVYGGLTNHTTNIAALNDISTQNGGSGTHTTELSAWSELSSVLNPYPAPSLQSFASDLTVIDKSGSKYFKATTGDDLLITNCDFTGKGWPVKSNATVDIFGQVGVPVISLFTGNFDYLNQYFTKTVAATFDANGVELTPLYISAIVAYSEPLTGADLTAANTYFAPEVELADKWVNYTAGLDTNAGTKALPYKKMSKAESVLTTGKTYVKSSEVIETGALFLKNLTYQGIGFSRLASSGTGYALRIRDSYLKTFKGIIIDGKNVDECIGYYIKFDNLVLEKCLLKNPKPTTAIINALYSGAFTTFSVNIKDSILINNNGNIFYNVCIAASWQYVKSCLIITNGYLIASSGIYGSFENNTIKRVNSGAGIVTTSGQIVKGNKFYSSGVSGDIYTENVTHTNKSSIIDNYIEQVDIFSQTFISLNGVASEVLRNTINVTGVSEVSTYNSSIIIRMLGVTSPKASNNTITVESARTIYFITVESNSIVCGAAEIIGNRINAKRAVNSGVIILDGEKAAAQHHKFDGCKLNDNIIYAPGYYGNGMGTMHCMMAWASNGEMKRNYINGAWIGCLIKGDTVNVIFGISNNKLINCGVSLYVKGTSGVEISHNYVDSDINVSSSNAIDVVKNIASLSQNTSIHHNTLIYRGSLASYRLIYIDHVDNLVGLTSDYNTFYTTQAHVATVGSTNYTFAQWQALGYDTHSVLLTEPPAFDDSETLPT